MGPPFHHHMSSAHAITQFLNALPHEPVLCHRSRQVPKNLAFQKADTLDGLARLGRCLFRAATCHRCQLRPIAADADELALPLRTLTDLTAGHPAGLCKARLPDIWYGLP
jgi:hypothetical protein